MNPSRQSAVGSRQWPKAASPPRGATLKLALGVVFSCLALTAVAGQWAATAEADLKPRIEKARPLAVEDVCVPVTSVRRGELMWVPNPDGKSCDLLQWYFRDYSGPTHVFIIDLATCEMKRDGVPNRRQIHIFGRDLYVAGTDHLRRIRGIVPQ